MSKHLRIVSGNISGVSLSPKKSQSEEYKINLKQIIRNSKEIEAEFVVIKFPKEILESGALLKSYCENIFYLSYLGANIIIIHELMDDSSDQKISQDYRCTLASRKIIKALSEEKVQAVSVFGSDSGMIRALRKKQKLENDIQKIDPNEEAEPKQIDSEILFNLQLANIVTVLSPIGLYGTYDREVLLDVDMTAAAISNSIDAKYLILPLENGAKLSLKDLEDVNSGVALSPAVKLMLAKGIAKVAIIDTLEPDAILNSVFNSEIVGG